jgi:hypothetical protein
VNYLPTLSLGDEAPVLYDFGKRVEMPLQVFDEDGGPVAVYYQFGDAAEWSEVPAINAPNMWPASMFANVDPNGKQDLQLLVKRKGTIWCFPRSRLVMITQYSSLDDGPGMVSYRIDVAEWSVPVPNNV